MKIYLCLHKDIFLNYIINHYFQTILSPSKLHSILDIFLSSNVSIAQISINDKKLADKLAINSARFFENPQNTKYHLFNPLT